MQDFFTNVIAVAQEQYQRIVDMNGFTITQQIVGIVVASLLVLVFIVFVGLAFRSLIPGKPKTNARRLGVPIPASAAVSKDYVDNHLLPVQPSAGTGENRIIVPRMGDFLARVEKANTPRAFATMARRIIKIGEELGELGEAFLVSTTTAPSRKVKTYADVREEAIDVAIVALDVALTPMPGEEAMTPEQIRNEVMATLDIKLAKWAAQSKMQAPENKDDAV